MLVVAFLQWWYGPGWRDASRRIISKIQDAYLNFSVPILLRTLFAPWRRITSAPGRSFDQKTRAMVDNLVSRAVGFAVRLLALIAACALIAIYALGGGVWLIVWPLLPIFGPALIVAGLV